MKLSDDDLRASLDRRASETPKKTLVGAARQVAMTPQRRRLGARAQLVGLVGAAASVAVALAFLGSLALRPITLGSQPPGSGSGLTASATASRPVEPTSAPVAWANLVWGKANAAPFAADGNTYVQDAIPDGTGFIAVGYTIDTKGAVTGRIWRTPDGRSWELLGGGWFANEQFDQIVPIDGGFVIVGAHRLPDLGDAMGPMAPAIWWSAEGSRWEERTPKGVDDLFLVIVAAGPDGLLISAANNESHRSWLRADADFNWTHPDASWPDDVRISGISSGGPGWIAAGVTGIDTRTSTGGTSRGAIWTSPDGVTWSPAEIEQPGGSISTVARVVGGYVATGSETNVACTDCLGGITSDPMITWSSADGLSWRRSGEFQPGIGNFAGGTIATNDGQRMLVFEMGVDGRLKVEETLDGAHWHEIAMWHETTMEASDVGAFPDFRVPFVGNAGLIVFGDASDGDPAKPASALPWYASASQPQPPNSATFPPRPAPTNNDFACPGTEPCGP